jgi:hypothetical protein
MVQERFGKAVTGPFSSVCGLFLPASLNAETGMLGQIDSGVSCLNVGSYCPIPRKTYGKAHNLGHRPDVRGLDLFRVRMVVPDSGASSRS